MKKSLICTFFVIIFLFSACGKTAKIDTNFGAYDKTAEIESTTASDASDEFVEPQSDIFVSQSNTQKCDEATAKNGNNTKAQIADAKNDISKTDNETEQPKLPYAISLSVDCSNAVAYGIRDNEAYKKIIPENGVIFSSDNIEISDGETVLNLLKRTLKANKIVYQITSGGYVKSISGLSEFDCGSNSGWLYRVNGVQPNVSSKSYKLSTGDKVEFIYTCKNGDVS